MINQRDIIIPDILAVKRKLDLFRIDNTRVVADFDSTITAHGWPTSWSFLWDIRELSTEYHEESARLFTKYHPYESDHSLSRDEHSRIMQEWWENHLGLFRKYWFRQEYFREIDVTKVSLRDGMQEGFEFFRQQDIPVLILSAWISQTIERVMENNNLSGSYISLTANRVLFDKWWDYEGIDPPWYIHVANKNEQHASKTAQEKYVWRANIILLWDNLADIHMIQPDERENTVAIGFCTSNKRDILERYTKIFDIVVTSDISDHWVLEYINRNISLE